MSFDKARIDLLKELKSKSSYGDNTKTYAWGDYEPFFTKDTAPNFFQRSDVKFESMPLEALGNDLWKRRLGGIIPYLPEGAYIAGGFMRSIVAGEEDITGDIDFFFDGSAAFEQMVQNLCKPMSGMMTDVFGGYKPEVDLMVAKHNSKAYRLINFLPPNGKPPIQLIKLIWFDGPEHVIDSFDLTIVQFVTDGKRLYYNPQAFVDVEAGRLRLHRSQSPITTLNRLLKYEKKGYSADPEEFADVADEASKMILGAKKDELNEYFYLPKADASVGNDRKLPVTWLTHAWKYLVESKNGRMIFAKLFGSKERVEQDLKRIEENALDKPEKKIYY